MNNESKSMTLDQFMAHMRSELKRFEDEWKEENAKRPEDYPMEFSSQFDWRDQLYCFLG